MRRAMLVKGSKPIFIFIVVCWVSGCYSEQSKTEGYVSKNFTEYANLYKTIEDSTQIYSDSLLKGFSNIFGEVWQIDSLICINSKKNKLVATINNSNGAGSYGVSDEISKLLGTKINGNWYFLSGASLVVPRDMYGKDKMHPLTFHELSQIARKEFLASALIKNETGEYVVDDKWIDDHFYNIGWGRFNDTARYDSVHWYYIVDKWKHKIDTNEYKPLRRKKTNSPAI